nr:8712_t:CDS:10 [Entrophospora candida]
MNSEPTRLPKSKRKLSFEHNTIRGAHNSTAKPTTTFDSIDANEESLLQRKIKLEKYLIKIIDKVQSDNQQIEQLLSRISDFESQIRFVKDQIFEKKNKLLVKNAFREKCIQINHSDANYQRLLSNFKSRITLRDEIDTESKENERTILINTHKIKIREICDNHKFLVQNTILSNESTDHRLKNEISNSIEALIRLISPKVLLESVLSVIRSTSKDISRVKKQFLEIYLKRNTQDIQDLVNQHKENHITKFIETEATYNEIFAVKERAKKLQNSIEIAIHNQFKHNPSMTNRIISLIKSKVELEAEKHTLDVLDKCVNDLRLRYQNVLCIDDGLKMICEHVNNSNEIIELKKSQIEQLNLINNQTISTFFNQLREVSEYIQRVLCPFSHDFEWIYKRIDCMMMKENEKFQKLDLKITVQLYYENENHHIGSLEIHRTLDDPFLKDVKDIIRSPKYLGAECIYMMLRELKSECTMYKNLRFIMNKNFLPHYYELNMIAKNWLSSVRNLMIDCNKNDSYTKTIESMQVAIEYLKENQIPRHKTKIDDLTKTTFHAIHEILEERNDFLCNFAMIC